MNTSIESIYILIKKHCINNYNKTYENIFTVEYINELFTKYNNRNEAKKIAYCLKTLNNIDIDYIINFNDINPLNNINGKMTTKRKDEKFKREVKARFKKCIICDEDDDNNNNNCCLECCDVAHIWDFAKCDNENDKYNSYNGLLMCANMHRLFDKELIKLNF